MSLRIRDAGSLDRRAFLVAGGAGFCGVNLARAAETTSTKRTPLRGKQPAKSCIMIWLSGGVSHIDTTDMKPHAPLEYRGEFNPVATSAPGLELCEHLPFTAKQAHHIAVVRSLGDFGRGTGDHHHGYYYNLTGHAGDPTFRQLLNARTPYPTDWPSMASTVAYKRPPHPFLPSVISLPQKEGAPEYTRPGQFGARLGLEFDPVFVDGSRDTPLKFTAPALQLHGDIGLERLQSRRDLLASFDGTTRLVEQSISAGSYSKQQEKAFSLLTAPQTKAAFDVSAEPESIRHQYGNSITATSFLMARRLVEAGVPFITVFWKEHKLLSTLCKSGGGWDTHGNNFGCLRDHLLPEFDRPFAALLADLHERGLLDTTLVLVSSEMGRRPKIGDPRSGGVSGAGRDHWTACQSVLLAGGGIQGGQAYGTTDKVAEYPADNPVGAEDIAHTVYRAMGIDDLNAFDALGRPFRLMEEGQPIASLF